MPTGSQISTWPIAAPILSKALKILGIASEHGIPGMMLAAQRQLATKPAGSLELTGHATPHDSGVDAAERVGVAEQVRPMHPTGQKHIDPVVCHEKPSFPIRVAADKRHDRHLTLLACSQ